mgnify:CR=1 FL=1
MTKNFRLILLICLLCLSVMLFCSCDGAADGWKIVRLTGEEKTVQEMSKRELEEAIRKRKEAEDELARVKQEKLDAEVRAENFAREAEKARADADIAQKSGKKMAENMRIIKAEHSASNVSSEDDLMALRNRKKESGGYQG